METNGYKGWLNSDSFLKRAFAVLGYNTVASLIIMIPLYVIFFLIAMMFLSGLSDARGNARDASERMRAAQEEIQQATDAPTQQDTTVNANLKLK